MSEARKIIDHNEIRKWAEDRGGVPALVKDTERAFCDSISMEAKKASKRSIGKRSSKHSKTKN